MRGNQEENDENLIQAKKMGNARNCKIPAQLNAQNLKQRIMNHRKVN
jgi:hypothetical protein